MPEPIAGDSDPAEKTEPVAGVDDTAAPRRRRWLPWSVGIGLVLAVGLVVVLGGFLDEDPDEVTAVAVGNMVCDRADPAVGSADECKAQEVSDIAVDLKPDAFFGLGDYVFEVPKADIYNTEYNSSWGRLRDITVPAIGNQEYKVHEANTFRSYFGDRAGPQQGYWSTEFGKWHVVVLNSNCTVVQGGCKEGSPQQQWLAEDLADSDAKCTVALMHHPRWSTGLGGPDGRLSDLFATLAANHVALVLSAHDADYERFPPMNADGVPDPSGTRQFVVGTGGQVVYEPGEGDAPWRSKGRVITSEFRDFSQHGVLELTLKPDSYDWSFHSLDGGVLDSGTGQCF